VPTSGSSLQLRGAWFCQTSAVKALFQEIRAGDVGAVRLRLDRDQSLVRAVATAPPKKDDGQSPLQVAIKSGQFAVAHALLDYGADVNFIDAAPSNPWQMPVLHDSIRAAVFNSRFTRNRARPGQPTSLEVMNSLEAFTVAASVLTRLVELGADVNAVDSYGNPGLARAALDARQVIELPMSAELEHDLTIIFAVLLDAGGDANHVDAKSGLSIAGVLGPARHLLQRRDN
jgi:ankyrin repeat protein